MTRVCPALEARALSVRHAPGKVGTSGLTEMLKVELSELENVTFIFRQSEKGKRRVFVPGESAEKA